MFCRKLIGMSCVFIFILSACGDSNSGSLNTFKPAATLPDLNEMSVPLGKLTQQSSVGFERHLKNGVYLRHQSQYRINLTDSPESSSSSGTNFSSTINQEEGVDEGDRIKYDGQYLFIATQESYQGTATDELNEDPAQTAIRIMERTDNGTMSEINKLTVNEEATNIKDVYLNNDVLAVLSDIYQYNIAASRFFEGFFPQEQHFNLSLVSVSQPQAAVVTDSFTVDGAIIDSRRIGDVLYIVSSFSAAMDEINYATTEKEKLDNYNTIMSKDIYEFLPKYIDKQGETHNLVSADNCYLPEQATELDGFDGIVTLTAVNLNNPSQLTSVCINAQVQGIYASQQSIYLYGTDYQYQENSTLETSVIHKFSMDAEQILYRATGLIAGRFNWGLSNLRFSEQGEYLRVVTTTGDSNVGYQHRLNVLMEEANALTVVSQLPNDINTQALGKVSDDGKVYEDIKSVRFYNEQAYVVTFLNTDPLYIIDLKNNLQPRVSGELEIPGYSAYLHPLSDDLLLGIGQNVDPARLPNASIDEDSTRDDSPVIEGAKVTLFDVSDLAHPQEIHSLVYENAYTPVEYDYHALTSLTMADGSMRFAFPIERWITKTLMDENQQKYDVWLPEHELAVVEVTSKKKSASLVDKGQILAITNDEAVSFINGWDDRAVFHDDDIYYIHGSYVWQSRWSAINLIEGPF
ncbi:beta-propeller domain-containing protein [Colwelliaceae bacterium 6441]